MSHLSLSSFSLEQAMTQWQGISEDPQELETMRYDAVSLVDCGHSVKQKTATGYNGVTQVGILQAGRVQNVKACSLCSVVPKAYIINHGLRSIIPQIERLIHYIKLEPSQKCSEKEIQQWKQSAAILQLFTSMRDDAVSLIPCGHCVKETHAKEYHRVVQAGMPQPQAVSTVKVCVICKAIPTAYVMNYSVRDSIKFAEWLISHTTPPSLSETTPKSRSITVQQVKSSMNVIGFSR